MNPRILLMLLFAVLARPELYAQANCSNPPNCISNWGTNSNGSPSMGDVINSSSNTMLPDWSVILGTPVYGPGMNGSTGILMVSDATNGEGVHTCYNFRSGRTYNICLWAYNTTTENRGELIIQAHDGTTGQIIRNGVFYQAPGYHQFQYSFTATQNFSQLRVYTNWTNGYSVNSSNPYSVVFDDIQVVEQPDLATSQSTINACQSAVLTASSINQLNISWSPSSGLSSTQGWMVTARPCSTTTYTASYTGVCGGACTNTKQITVNVQQGTSVNASPSTISGCQNSTLTASSAGSMSVTWSPSTGLSSTHGNVVTAQPCSTTTYTASFYCAQSGCTYTQQVTVYVQPSGSITPATQTIPCSGAISMSYAGNPCAGSTYSWVGPKGNVLSTGTSLNMPSSTPGDEGTFTLTITSPQGCVSKYTAIVQMTGCCSVAADFDIVGCNPIRFVNNTSANGNPVIQGEWHWDFGDGNTGSIRNPSHLYTTKMGPTTVCLTAIASDGISTCCDKICKDVNVCDFGPCEPRAAFDYRINPSTNDVQFIDLSVGAGSNCGGWTWKVDGVPQAWTQNPVINIPSGQHSICLEVWYCTNGPSCPDEWCEDIIIP